MGGRLFSSRFHRNSHATGKSGASGEDVKAIENLFTDGGVIFSDSLSKVQQQRNLYHTFAVLVYGFLSIIVAITIFHIMNTINMGVTAKMKEYGGMRAIGMSDRQLIKMIVAEAGTYAINGAIGGCIIGLPMHWVIYVSLITNIWGLQNGYKECLSLKISAHNNLSKSTLSLMWLMKKHRI